MDVTRANTLTRPPIHAAFAPVWWEPLPGSGERICALVLISPDPEAATLLMPAAHVVISTRRLKAMLGAQRGESAAGILAEVSRFMSRGLLAGAPLQDTKPPFRGFEIGPARRVKAFTAEQALDAAVSLCSAFGSAEDLVDEANDGNNTSTITTREFLAKLQAAFSPANDQKRQRFGVSVPAGGATLSIDYVFKKHLVQFTSAPLTERQANNMRREAMAKILECITVKTSVMDDNALPHLLINTAPLALGDLDRHAVHIANASMAHYQQLGKLHSVEVAQTDSVEDAVMALSAFE